MRFITVLFWCIALLIHSSFVFAGNRLLHYEPDIVEVSGIVDVLTFPGPPNYEDTRTGDMPEKCGYLKLDYPIDVDLSINSDPLTNDEPKKNIRVLQLVLGHQEKWPKITPGSHVRITGTLFAALTGHHHARILINVHKINICSKKQYFHVMNDRSLSEEFN